MCFYPLSIQLKLEAIDEHRHLTSLSWAEAHNVLYFLSIQLKLEAIDRTCTLFLYTPIPLYPYTPYLPIPLISLIPLSPVSPLSPLSPRIHGIKRHSTVLNLHLNP